MPTAFKPEVPADVPHAVEQDFINNYATITRDTGKLFLFACDQKIEHLNTDFYGHAITPEALHPEHLFRIGAQAPIGALATHPGLIARYGKKYPTISYIAKLNGTTHLVKPEQRDPISRLLWHVDDVITLKKNTGLAIRGIGYTLYLGSEHEPLMLEQAAQAIYHAHQYGLVTILWVYPRGKSIADENDPALIAGATGIAHALGSDFVKVKPLQNTDQMKIATAAAGNTKVICSGGKHIHAELFLKALEEQLTAGTAGTATGRNLFQKPLPEAIAFAHAIASMVYDRNNAATAYSLYAKHIK